MSTKLKTCEICFEMDGYVYISMQKDDWTGEWDGELVRCPICGKRGRPKKAHLTPLAPDTATPSDNEAALRK